jgi:hypothetical protein
VGATATCEADPVAPSTAPADPVRHRPRPRISRAVIISVAVAVTLAAGITPAGAASSSPRDRLRRASHGTLTSGFGTLQFHSDGTARFVVKECGYQPLRPGFVTTFTDCPPDTTTGKLTVTDSGYQLIRKDGSGIRFGAYVDPSNRLHVGFGAVGRVAADRTGTVSISPSEQLVVTRSGCRYVQPGATQTVPCQFTQDSGRSILTYAAPTAGAQTGTQLTGLVYLPSLRLLVSPDMVDRVYRPK